MIVEALRQIRSYIDTPEKWTKEAFARAEDDVKCSSVWDLRACKFCLFGAIIHTTDTSRNDAERIIRKLALARIPPDVDAYYCDAVVGFNDHSSTTHADVLRLLDDAISIAEKEQK